MTTPEIPVINQETKEYLGEPVESMFEILNIAARDGVELVTSYARGDKWLAFRGATVEVKPKRPVDIDTMDIQRVGRIKWRQDEQPFSASNFKIESWDGKPAIEFWTDPVEMADGSGHKKYDRIMVPEGAAEFRLFREDNGN